MGAKSIITALLVPLITSYAEASVKVWIADAGFKIQPKTPVPTSPTVGIILNAGGASYVSAQIIVTAIGSPVQAVNISSSNLICTTTPTLQITTGNITFFNEHFIDFTNVHDYAFGGMKPANVKTDPFVPDPLIPFNDPYTHAPVGAPFDVPAGSNQPIWVDIYILKNTPACSFQGTFIVTSNGVSVAAIPVTIITYGINIPDSGSGPKTPFKISFGNLPSFHKGATFNVNSPYTQLLVRRYEDFSHAHRVNTRFNPFTVLVGYGTDGCAPPTQANLQAWAQSVAGYFDGSYFSDGVPVNSFYTDFNPGGGWGLDSCSAAQIQDIAAVWAAFLKKQGWFHKAIAATADEPSYSASDLSSLKSIAAHAQAMVQGDADWLAQIMVTTPASSLSAPVLGSSVGVYCTYLTAFDTWWHQNVSPNPLYYGRKEWPSFRAGPPAHSMWFYECSGMGKPYPTFSTNTLLATEPMIMFWASYFENATGFLYWDMAYWNLTSSWGPNTLFPKLGDGVLLYPGAHDGTAGANAGSPAGVNIAGPIGSIRLKMIRQGLQDWSLFSFASQSGLDSFTRKAVSEIYGNLGACNWDGCLPPPINKTYYWDYSNYTHIEDVRRRVFQALKDLSPSPLAQAASSSTTSTLVTSSTSKTLSTSTTTAFLAVTTTVSILVLTKTVTVTVTPTVFSCVC